MLRTTNFSYSTSKTPFGSNVAGEAASAEKSQGLSEWASQCKYECLHCKQFVTNQYGRFEQHLKTHRLTRASHKTKYGQFMSERVYHECMICKKKITHERYSLQSHLRALHNVSIEDYFVEHIRRLQSPSLPLATRTTVQSPLSLNPPPPPRPQEKALSTTCD